MTANAAIATAGTWSPTATSAARQSRRSGVGSTLVAEFLSRAQNRSTRLQCLLMAGSVHYMPVRDCQLAKCVARPMTLARMGGNRGIRWHRNSGSAVANLGVDMVAILIFFVQAIAHLGSK